LSKLDKVSLAILIVAALFLFSVQVSQAVAPPSAGSALQGEIELSIIGRVLNSQKSPVDAAEVIIFVSGQPQKLKPDQQGAEGVGTDRAGYFFVDLHLPEEQISSRNIAIEISKNGYQTTRQGFPARELACTAQHCYVRIPDVTLPRTFNPAFFLATGIFVVVFGVISFNALHETIAALLGTAAMLGVSYFAGSANADYWIIGFHRAIDFIDFDVIFLLMTMMIFMAIMSDTGVFQWLAYQSFRLGRGDAYFVTAGLVLITGVTSAVLNDTTVMLLMAPVSIQIALALGIQPAAIVIPEILASNIGGAATLIGTPPNTVIGSYVGLTFNQFLGNMLPIAVMGMALLLVMTRMLFRTEFDRERAEVSENYVERLEARSRIENPTLLRKSLLLFSLTLGLFFLADIFLMPAAVVAILGSTALLLWVRPNVHDMLREVDWTTLVFFMGLFMMVGGIQEVGLIQLIAESVRKVAGGDLLLATMMIIWVSAIASALVANIPFASAIVPVTVFLTQTIPGAENNVLYWALALGAGLGGNATYIGSAPNIVAVGILDRAGYRLKFHEFSRIGVPVTFVTVLVPSIWILIRYFWLQF
jgi:Na+/H+ antiporter NhaD/arsenite permease-like protein